MALFALLSIDCVIAHPTFGLFHSSSHFGVQINMDTLRRTHTTIFPKDPCKRPIVRSPKNKLINKKLKQIEKARHNLRKLMAFVGKFRGSSGTEEDLQKASTYYAMAGRYL